MKARYLIFLLLFSWAVMTVGCSSSGEEQIATPPAMVVIEHQLPTITNTPHPTDTSPATETFTPTSTIEATSTIPPTVAATSTPIVSMGSHVTAVYWVAPPTLDGELSEWRDVPAVSSAFPVFQATGWDGSADLEVIWRVVWDDTHLYFAASIQDDVHVQTETGNLVYRGDSLEIQLDTDRIGDFGPEPSPDDFQILLSPGNFETLPPSAFRFQGTSSGGISDAPGHHIVVAAQPTAEGYALETAIPWVDLNMQPQAGLVLGLALNASDNDKPETAVQEVMVSHVPNRTLTNPTTWGTLALVLSVSDVVSLDIPTPAPTSCAIPISNSLRPVWENHAAQLGCAIENGKNIPMVTENFQHGRMFWRSDNRVIYVLYSTGSWASYTDRWREGNAEFSCGNTSSPPTPKRGFGKVWCENNNVRQGLGDAIDAEYATSGFLQHYNGGLILQAGGRTFVFYDNSTWR